MRTLAKLPSSIKELHNHPWHNLAFKDVATYSKAFMQEVTAVSKTSVTRRDNEGYNHFKSFLEAIIKKHMNSELKQWNDIRDYLNSLTTTVNKNLLQSCLHSSQMSKNVKYSKLISKHLQGEIPKNQSFYLINITFPTSLINKSYPTRTCGSLQQNLKNAIFNIKHEHGIDNIQMLISPLKCAAHTDATVIIKRCALSSTLPINFKANYGSYIWNFFAKRRAALTEGTVQSKRIKTNSYIRAQVENVRDCNVKAGQHKSCPPPKKSAVDNCKAVDNYKTYDPCKECDYPNSCKEKFQKLNHQKDDDLKSKINKMPTGYVSLKCKKDDNFMKKDDACERVKENPCKQASRCDNIGKTLTNHWLDEKKQDPCKNEKTIDSKHKNPCGRKNDPCKHRKSSPCSSRKKEPCEKRKDVAKKPKNYPCKSQTGHKKENMSNKNKDDPCKKKSTYSECDKKKENTCNKDKDDPCKKTSTYSECDKKKENACNKDRDDPCKRKNTYPECDKKNYDACSQKPISPCKSSKSSDQKKQNCVVAKGETKPNCDKNKK